MVLDLVGQVTGMHDRRVAATWLQGWTIHWALGPVLVAWLDERRGAPIDSWGMALAWDGQTPLVWLADGAWAGLPDDPLARAAGDLIVAHDPGTLTAISWSARGRFVACPAGSASVPRSSGFVYQRATCCLAFKASDGELCPTCPVRRDHAHGAGTTSGAQSPWLGDCSREPS